MSIMFDRAHSFNQNISSWDVSNVTDMDQMFDEAYIFNQDISSWDVSNVTNMGNMFNDTALSDENRCAIHTSFSSNEYWPYDWSEFCGPTPITQGNIHQAVDLWVSDQAQAEATYGHISDWDVSGVVSMDYLFLDKPFTDDISGWDVSELENMHGMFRYTSGAVDSSDQFNGDISNWDVSQVTNMAEMFLGNENFSIDLSNWEISNVTLTRNMFQNTNFNGVIDSWDMSNVTGMGCMFCNNPEFNQDLSNWDVSSATNMDEVFGEATSFNSDISSWDVSNATNMNYMFRNTSSFDQDISDWDITNVTEMNDIFGGQIGLSDDNKCSINESFSSNESWPHDWSEFCVPTIASIIDVPEDQGGRVYVSFNASFFDVSEDSNQSYGIMRYDYFENDSSGWVALMSFPAIGEGSYTYEVTTLRDSTADDDGITEFKVVAAMNEGNFHSEPAMGYSVDNIAPGVPTGLMATAVDVGIHLTWDLSPDDDFQYFTLEKSSDADFTDYESFETIDTSFTDMEYEMNETYFYRIVAVDHAGNISDYSGTVEATVLSIDIDQIPQVFALHQNYPNPFNPTTQITYDLPEDALVNVTIYDMTGRIVNTMVNMEQNAGYKSIQWNATNNLGQTVAAGIYLYTIQTGEFRQTKKMVLLK